MPKSFSADEEKKIKIDLMTKGKELFTIIGLKKTSIDDLVKATGIAKGSFYKFFPSKEILYLEILENEERAIRESLAEFNLKGKELKKSNLKAFFTGIVSYLESNPILLKMFDEKSLEQIMRKVPPERLEQHIKNDNDWSAQLFQSWKKEGFLPDTDEKVFSALFRSIFILFTQKETIGKEQFIPVMDLLFDYICDGIINSKETL